MSFKLTCDALRSQIKDITTSVVKLRLDLLENAYDLPNNADRGEMIANTILALRHLDGARMRVGKAIQAFEGGVSCYDRHIVTGGTCSKCGKAVTDKTGTITVQPDGSWTCEECTKQKTP